MLDPKDSTFDEQSTVGTRPPPGTEAPHLPRRKRAIYRAAAHKAFKRLACALPRRKSLLLEPLAFSSEGWRRVKKRAGSRRDAAADGNISLAMLAPLPLLFLLLFFALLVAILRRVFPDVRVGKIQLARLETQPIHGVARTVAVLRVGARCPPAWLRQ